MPGCQGAGAPYNLHVRCDGRSVRQLGVALLAVVVYVGCGGSEPGVAPSPSPQPPATPAARILVVTHTEGFRHDSIPAAEAAIRDMGTESGLFSTDFCRTADDVRNIITVQGLAPYQAIVFANTTGSLPIRDLAAFLSWVSGGRGFVGIHSASDTFHDRAEYIAMLGGEFLTHGAIVEAEIRVDDASQASVAHLAPLFRMTDEFYRFTRRDPNVARLLSLPREPNDGAGAGATDLPLAWQKPFGAGRVFYTALGHRTELWQDARYRRHVLEGIRWAMSR